MVCDLNQNNLKEHLENYVNAIIERLSKNPKFNDKDIAKQIYSDILTAKNDTKQALAVAYHIPQLTYNLIKNNPQINEIELVKKGYNPTVLLNDIIKLQDSVDKLKGISDYIGLTTVSVASLQALNASQATPADKILTKAEKSDSLSIQNILHTHTLLSTTGVTVKELSVDGVSKAIKSTDTRDPDKVFYQETLVKLLNSRVDTDVPFEEVEYSGKKGFKLISVLESDIEGEKKKGRDVKDETGKSWLDRKVVQLAITNNKGEFYFFKPDGTIGDKTNGKVLYFTLKAGTESQIEGAINSAKSALSDKLTPEERKIAEASIEKTILKELNVLKRLSIVTKNEGKNILLNITGGSKGVALKDLRISSENTLSDFELSDNEINSITLFDDVFTKSGKNVTPHIKFDNYDYYANLSNSKKIGDQDPELLEHLVTVLTEKIKGLSDVDKHTYVKQFINMSHISKDAQVLNQYVIGFKDSNKELYMMIDGKTIPLNSTEASKNMVRDFLGKNVSIHFHKESYENKGYKKVTFKENADKQLEVSSEQKLPYIPFILNKFSPSIIMDKSSKRPMVVDGYLTFNFIQKAEKVNEEIKETTQKIIEAKVPTKADEIEDDFESLKRSRLIESLATPEQKEVAEKWWKESFLSSALDKNGRPLFKLMDLRNQVNSDAWATYEKAVIKLYEGSDFTHGYHEAWHAFSQVFLTKKERTSLYDGIADLEGTFEVVRRTPGTTEVKLETVKFSEASRLELEEFIAEEFRIFAMNNGKFKTKNAKTNILSKIFSKMWEALKALMGKTNNVYSAPGTSSVLGEIFNTLYTAKSQEDLLNYSPNLENAEFGILNSGGILTEKSPDHLTESEALLLTRSIDGLLSEAITADVQKSEYSAVSLIFSSPNKLTKLYQDIKVKLNDKRIELLNEINELNLEEANPLKDQQLSILTSKLNILNKAVKDEVFGDIKGTITGKVKTSSLVAFHREHSTFSDVFYTLKEEEDKDPSDDENERPEETSKSFDAGPNSTASEKLADPTVLYLVKSLIKKDANNNNELNELGFPEPIEFLPFWRVLMDKVAGETTIIGLYSKLKQAADSKVSPLFQQLLDKVYVQAEEDGTYLTADASLGIMFTQGSAIGKLWLKMLQSLNLHKTELVANIIEVNKKGETTIKVGRISDEHKQFLNKIWLNKFNQKNTDSFTKKNKNGTNIINLKNVVNTYLKKNKDDGLYYIEDKSQYVPFLNSIGIYMSDKRVIKEALNKETVNLNYIAKSIGKIYENNLASEEDFKETGIDEGTIEISNIVDTLSKNIKLPNKIDGKAVLVEHNTQVLIDFATLEAQYSTEYTSSMKKSADNNLKSTFASNSSDTIKINALNKAERINDLYSESAEMIHMNFLNPENNPLAKGLITLKSLFAENGVKIKDRTVSYRDLTGTSYMNASEDEFISDGKSHVKMGFLDTVLSNFISTIGGGYMKSITPGDKSSYLALKLNKITTYSEKVNPNLYVDTIAFFKNIDNEFIEGYNPMSKVLDMLYPKLEAEIRRIAMVKADKKLPENEQWYNKLTGFKDADKFDIFDEILDSKLKETLTSDEFLNRLNEVEKSLTDSYDASVLKNLLFNDESLKNTINNQILNYFDKLQATYDKDLFDPIFGVNKPMPKSLEELAVKDFNDKNKIDEIYGKDVFDKSLRIRYAATRSFMINNFIHKTETTVLFQGDGFQFNHEKDEITKRTSGSQSSGTIFPVDILTQLIINNKVGRPYEKQLIAEGIIEEKNIRTYGPILNSAVIAESKVASVYFDMYRDLFKKDFEERGLTGDALNAALYGVDKKGKPGSDRKNAEGIYDDIYNGGKMKPFINIEDGDGQGWITFDTYRILKYAEGTWTNDQETLYNKILNKEAVKASDISDIFPVYKLQYTGPLATKKGVLPVQAFHKFSLFPLIPSVIKNTPAETVHKNMISQNIDYALFKSGSKRSSINADNKSVGDRIFNKTTEDLKEDVVFTPNPIYIAYLKNQTVVNSYFKEESTFSSQLRKLITTNMYSNGVPLDFRKNFKTNEEAITAWDKVEDKIIESKFHALSEKLRASVDDLVRYKKAELLEELDWTEEDLNNPNVSPEKVKSMLLILSKELKNQGFSEHELELFNTSGKEAVDLSVSPLAARFERMILAIVNNRIIKSKLKGEALVEVSSSLMQNSKFRKATDAENLKYNNFGTNGLSSYVADGVNKTIGFKFKRALTKMDENLFKTKYFVKNSDGEYVDSGEEIAVYKEGVENEIDFNASFARLNEMLLLDKWLADDNNNKKIRLTGVRIPTQGHNSMEFGQVAEFLLPEAGTVIIIPAEIVAKSGTDFDVDKMTTYSPSLTSTGKLMSKYTKEEVKAKIKEIKNSFDEEVKKSKNSNWLDIQTKLGNFRYEIKRGLKKLNTIDPNLVKILTNVKNRELIKSLEDPAIENTIKDLFPRAYKAFIKDIKGVTADDLDTVVKDLKTLKETNPKLYNLSIALQDAYDEKNNLLGGIQNELIENMTSILELPELAASLLSPNDTNLAQPLAEEIKGFIQKADNETDHTKSIITGEKVRSVGISPTKAYTENYNTKKQLENTASKDSLGIAAVDNYINILLNSAGAKLKKEIRAVGKTLKTVKNEAKYVDTMIKVDIDLFLKHNKLNGGISLSHIIDANDNNSIADVINQLMNGFVDAGKDAWVVYLQGNPEVVPKFLFLLEAGVPIKDIAYFVSNPITRFYIKEKADRSALLAKFMKKGSKNKVSDEIINRLNIGRSNKELIAANLDTYSSQAAMYAYQTVLKNIASGNDFTEENLKKIAKESKDFNNESQIAGFLQYMYIEKLVEDYDTLKKVMNFDTKKTSDLYSAQNKIKDVELLNDSDVIEKSTIKHISENSIIAPFYIQDFSRKLFSRLFKLRDASEINSFLSDIFSNKNEIKNAISARKITGFDNETYIARFKNFVSHYIFANELRRYSADTNIYKTVDGKNIEVSAETLKNINNEFDNVSFNIEAFPLTNDGLPDEKLRTDFIEFSLEKLYLRRILPLDKVKNSKEFSSRKDRLKLSDDLTNAQKDSITYEDMITNKALTNTYNIWQLFRSGDNTIAVELMDIIKNYPELSESTKYSLLKQFIPEGIPNDKDYKNFINFKLKNYAELDEALISDYNKQWKDLANPGVFKLTSGTAADAEANAYISNFFSNLPIYAFLQSGMNSSQFSLSSIMPYDKYESIMEKASSKFLNKLKTEDSTKLLRGINSLFQSQNDSKNKKLINRGALVKVLPVNLPASENSIYEQPFIKESEKAPGVYLLDKTYVSNGKTLQVSKDSIERLRKANPNVKFLLSPADLFNLKTNKASDKILSDEEIDSAISDPTYTAMVKALKLIKLSGYDVVIYKEGFGENPVPLYADISEELAELNEEVVNESKEVVEGVKIIEKAITPAEELELFNELKPYLESQGSQTNKGNKAPIMIGLGLRWDYTSNNPGKKPVELGETINNSTYQKNKYRYYNLAHNGQPLGKISQRLKDLMKKATGIDTTNYDGAIINVYPETGFISAHNDVDESITAINYPVLVLNIGGSGNLSIEGAESKKAKKSYSEKIYTDVDLNSGDAYIFGENGLNRDVFHRTLPSSVDGTLPELNIQGQIIPANSYRITITMRRVMPLKPSMPKNPIINLSKPADYVNHSGGAKGADMVWDIEGRKVGITNHRHYTTQYYDKLSLAKKEAVENMYKEAAKFLGRSILLVNSPGGKLVRRDMIQSHNGEAIYGITDLVKPGVKGRKGYNNKMSYSIPEGGTGYAIANGILSEKPVYVFNQSDDYGNDIGWYKWDSSMNDFVKSDTPVLTSNFTGIGSTKINEIGKQAIRDVYNNTFKSSTSDQVQANTTELTPAEEQVVTTTKLSNFIAEAIAKTFGIDMPIAEPEKIISDFDSNRFKEELERTGTYPKEFFTNDGESKWILDTNNNYTLVDKMTGDIYLRNFSFDTGNVIDEKVQKTPVNEEYRAKKIADIEYFMKKGLNEMLAVKNYDGQDFISKLEAASTQEEVNDILNQLNRLIC